MLGAPGVGKTSLVKQFVEGRFDEGYLKTLGVKIDRKHVATTAGPVSLIVWDIYGDEDELPSNRRHLRGMAGSLLVIDGTRPATVSVAAEIQHTNLQDKLTGPYVVLVNKGDLVADPTALLETMRVEASELFDGAVATFVTSAVDGMNVNASFEALALAMIS